jgi:hypothetical protein
MGEIHLDEGTYRRTQRRREDLFRSRADVDELGGGWSAFHLRNVVHRLS